MVSGGLNVRAWRRRTGPSAPAAAPRNPSINPTPTAVLALG